MTTDTRQDRRGLRALVDEALPCGAVPTGTACHPLPRYVLEHAQEDVVSLARQRMSDQLQGQQHVVLTLTGDLLDPEVDADVVRLLECTDGGVLVFAVTYSSPPEAVMVPEESCPECGSRDAFHVVASPAASTPHPAVLIECRDCEAVWESEAR